MEENDSRSRSAGEIEHGRLDLQHELITLKIGGLVLPQALNAVAKALEHRSDHNPPKILDVGTGSGVWPIRMAQQYPLAQVTGLDIEPPNTHV